MSFKRMINAVETHAGIPMRVGDKVAVVPTITGRSYIFGFNTFVLDHEDPFPEGYTIGDIWA